MQLPTRTPAAQTPKEPRPQGKLLGEKRCGGAAHSASTAYTWLTAPRRPEQVRPWPKAYRVEDARCTTLQESQPQGRLPYKGRSGGAAHSAKIT
jgi:hypothetical protein